MTTQKTFLLTFSLLILTTMSLLVVSVNSSHQEQTNKVYLSVECSWIKTENQDAFLETKAKSLEKFCGEVMRAVHKSDKYILTQSKEGRKLDASFHISSQTNRLSSIRLITSNFPNDQTLRLSLAGIGRTIIYDEPKIFERTTQTLAKAEYVK